MSLLNQNIPELKANSIDAIHYKIMDIMKKYPVGKALDFPAGWGRLSYWLKEKCYNVTSCDIQEYPDSNNYFTVYLNRSRLKKILKEWSIRQGSII